ncbi:hypothetical protein [Dysosmobacter sp.]|uniref:hypothetical protein n=1 Tax=Dysosmobacter sp. TaxID=2591382 RepID=UPI002A8C0C9D|nr:hypothetical protein [Dysosmobacter sp.]MDY3986149.1 hypothetical protein [Dysosmobacter sp.]
MVFETIALSVITVLLLLLTLTRKPGHIKLLLALLSAVASIVSMVFFILMRRSSGNPDAGQDLLQVYAPCGIYVLIALFCLAVAALSRRKLRQDKAAKAAAKAEKTAEKAAAKPEQET